MSKSINYNVLPRTRCSGSSHAHHPRNVAAELRLKLHELDPNQDGSITKAEVRTYYPLMVKSWRRMQKDFTTVRTTWLKSKNAPCKCNQGDKNCVQSKTIATTASRILPRPLASINAKAFTYVSGQLRLRRITRSGFFRLDEHRNPKTDRSLTIMFKRLHPVMKSHVGRHRHWIKVTITHYSRQKTILYIHPKTLKIHGSPRLYRKFHPAIEKVTLSKRLGSC